MGMLLPRLTMLEPYYEVHINGSKLSNAYKRYITQVEVEESDSEADLGRVTVADKDFIFTNNINLSENAPIKIYMGHSKKFRLVLDGQITHIDADFGEDGVPRIVIGAIDNTNKMTSVKKSRIFKNKTVSEVAKSIAGEYGFKPKIQDTSPVIDQITQDEETDAQFLTKLADGEAFNMYIITDTNELYFGDKIADSTVADTIHYNSGDSTIMNFRPTLIEKNKPEKVESKSSNLSEKTGKKDVKKEQSSGGAGTPPPKSNAGGAGGGAGVVEASPGRNSGISTSTGAIVTKN